MGIVKKGTSALCGLLLGASLTSCGDSSGASADEFVIGVVADDSGPGASYSKIGVEAIHVAVDDINAHGGVLGKRLRVVVRSDDSQPSKSPTVTRRLIGQDGASAILFTTGSGSIIADKTVLQEAEVAGLAPTSFTTEVIEQPDADFMYIQVPSTVHQAQAFMGAFRTLGAKRVAIFTDDTPTMAAYTKSYRKQFIDAGFEVVADEKAASDAADVTAQVSRIAAARPDVVLASMVGGQGEVLFHNTAEMIMPDVQRFSLASIGNQPQVWKLADPKALDGLVFAGARSSGNSRTADLRAKFEHRLGPGFQMTDYHAQAYNSVHLLADAIRRSGTGKPKDVHAALNKTSEVPAYFGQESFTISYGPDKHDGADGPCGLVLRVFRQNTGTEPWDVYQPSCGRQP